MTVIVRVRPTEPVSLAPLLRMPLGLDVWEVQPDSVVLRAPESVLERLERMGYTVEQLDTTERHLAAFATEEALAGYHSAATLEQDLRRLVEREPEVTELREIGRSVENRPIWALRIGERRGSEDKLLFLGCHHAREWISVEVAYRLAEHLVGSANTAPVRDWLQQAELWVAPMVNPDGHEYSHTQDRLWRKNRRINVDGSMGVDPNRNYGYLWGTLHVNTASHVPSDETYVGRRAFSEPETRAVRDLVAREPFRGVITYHSYSQLILYPWGYTDEPIPDVTDRMRMVELAQRMGQLIEDVHGSVYTPQQASELYPTAGDTTDWTYGEYGIASFTIELRPRSQEEGGFILPASQIVPTWEESRPAALEFIRATLEVPAAVAVSNATSG